MEAFEDGGGVGVAGRDGTASAGVATFKVDFADGEADGGAVVFGEEAVFPEGGELFAASAAGWIEIDFESGAEAEADIVEGEAEPVGNGLKRSGRDDGGTVCEGVIGEAAGRIANDNLLLEEEAKPFGGVFVGFGEGEGARRDAAEVGGDGESDGAEVGGVAGADVVDERSALAVDPSAVDGIEGPGAVESEPAGGGDAGFGNGDGIEGFDGMEADVGKDGSRGKRVHKEILAEARDWPQRIRSGRGISDIRKPEQGDRYLRGERSP